MRLSLFAGGSVVLATAAAAASFTLDRRALWPVVDACVVDQQLTGLPAPCLEVDLTGGRRLGHVVLRDPITGDLILAPTRKSPGVEDPFLYSPEAPNFFQAAWLARRFLSGPDGKPPDRERIALAVNSGMTRSQDQLHIHIGCLVPAVAESVTRTAPRLPIGEWTQVGTIVPHSLFWAMRVGGSDLAGVRVLNLAVDHLVTRLRSRRQIMVAVAAVKVAGEDGFLILASYAGVPGGSSVGAENILDSNCPTPPK